MASLGAIHLLTFEVDNPVNLVYGTGHTTLTYHTGSNLLCLGTTRRDMGGDNTISVSMQTLATALTFTGGIASSLPSSSKEMLTYSLLADKMLCSMTARSRMVDPGTWGLSTSDRGEYWVI